MIICCIELCMYQADEVEALSAIYGSDWSVEDAVDRRYSIGINDGSTDAENCIQLQVSSTCDLLAGFSFSLLLQL